MFARIRRFFFPPTGASLLRRLLPFALLVVVLFGAALGVAYAWDYTNSPEFCGTACHTMPPEFAAYQVSPHARVACVECHIGRDFIATRVTRKVGDLQHVIATLFETYEFPIRANKLRPARETCERCHYPAKFSDDSLRELIRFHDDAENSRYSIFLAMRTGGGTQREGLGRGIHWHVENQVWFVAEDPLQQRIPYVRVVGPDGEEDVFIALDTTLSPEELAEMPQVEMDCITCHNRISHNILPPYQSVNRALARQQIDAGIPNIRALAVETLSAEYASDAAAHEALNGLIDRYAAEEPAFFAANEESVRQAVDMLIAIYDDSVFREQKVDWQSHPNNIGHKDWPGCFRCHDGQHVNQDNETIRLECNLCHSIPLVVEPATIEPQLPLVTGIQPESHFSTHWIALHREALDQTCQACHDIGNAGGTDNTSFCSNAMCHGVGWEYAGLDAPGLAEILAETLPAVASPETAAAGSEPTFTGEIGAMLRERCGACHGEGVATGGLVLTSFDGVMAGGSSGAVIVPGDAEASRAVQLQREGHFSTLANEQLQALIDWIDAGAPEGEPGAPTGEGAPTYESDIGDLLQAGCATCHSERVASGGLALTTYEAAMTGGDSGPAITPGDAEASLLVEMQHKGHFSQLSAADLQRVIDWIDAGAPER